MTAADSQTTTETVKRGSADQTAPLFPADQANGFRRQWQEIQAGFVDDPRRAVARANDLVEAVIGELTQTFDRTQADLESQWESGGDVSTEDLRVALQRYRSFFDRLLSV